MPLFAATITLSALLLFLVQPIIAKQILPWFGGSAGVWSVCMVFFQALLLAGYAYAHFLVHRLRRALQVRVHGALLLLSLLLLPIVASPGMQAAAGADADAAILLVLARSIGLPYFLLSSTGPLLQSWIAHRFAARSVYRMYALSNLGSLLGLIAFPFVVDPLMPAHLQAISWSAAYALFVAGCCAAAWQCRREPPAEEDDIAPAVHGAEGSADRARVLPGSQPAVWLALSALGVVLLLATTNQLQQNVASAPFLWVLPLALYLLSFVVVFEGRQGLGWYGPRWGVPLALGAAVLMALSLTASSGVLDVGLAVPLDCLGMFAICVFCHGELAARKPAHAQLTKFYLMVSIGGALGGAFVGLVAPRIFASLYELPLALAAVALAALLAALHRPDIAHSWARALALLSAVALLGIVWQDWRYMRFLDHDLIVMQRNFYGTLRVREVDEGGVRTRRLLHGVILHGEQAQSGPRQNLPGSYYSPSSGVGLAIRAAQERHAAVRIGVVGLGVGTLAAYGRAGDEVRFYELDPDVATLARTRFTYLSASAARVQVVPGDARLSLESERAGGRQPGLDVLAVDAFASDSIPIHLLTREAIALYMNRLAPDGILAVHISNRFLDLQPVLANIAAREGLQARLVDDTVDDDSPASSSDWVLLARDPRLLSGGDIGARASALPVRADLGVWTDGASNVFGVLKVSPLRALREMLGLGEDS